MKVLCIDNAKCPELTEGAIYTVVHSRLHPTSKRLGYRLKEVIPVGFYTEYFVAHRFIPLSDIDEKEFERNYNKQLA